MRTYAEEVRQLRDCWRGKGWTLAQFQDHVTKLAGRPLDWHTIEGKYGSSYRTHLGEHTVTVHDHAGNLSLTVSTITEAR